MRWRLSAMTRHSEMTAAKPKFAPTSRAIAVDAFRNTVVVLAEHGLGKCQGIGPIASWTVV
jgi:hypothetical protein